MDTSGRAIFFNIENLTLGNVYFQSGTDNISRVAREKVSAETIPQLLLNHKVRGILGGDLNCITKKQDATHNPDAKMSPSLTRVLQTFSHSDCFRRLYPNKVAFSRFYNGAVGGVGASRIDRSYSWGDISIQEAEYISIAFSDHMAHVVTVSAPDISPLLPPQSRPLFKISPEIVHDRIFKQRLEKEFDGWKQVKERRKRTCHNAMVGNHAWSSLGFAILPSIEAKNLIRRKKI